MIAFRPSNWDSGFFIRESDMANEFPFEKFFSSSNTEMENSRQPDLQVQENNSAKNSDSMENKILEAQLLNHFEQNIPQDKFNTYFKDRISVKTVSETEITLTVKTQFIKSVLEASFQSVIEQAISGFFE